MMFEKSQIQDPKQRIAQARRWRHLRTRLRYLSPELRQRVLVRWQSPRLKSTRTPTLLNWLIFNSVALAKNDSGITFAPSTNTQLSSV